VSEQIGFERAQNQATDLARRLEQQIKKPADLDTVGKAQGLTPQESGFFAREEPITGLGASPEAAARAFDMTDGQVSGALRTGRGYVIETVVGRQDAYLPKLEEVKEKVRDEILRTKAKDVARKKADELAPK